MNFSSKYSGLILMAMLGFWLGASQLPLFDLDEGAFSQATLEMLANQQFLTTTLDGAPRYDKPMFSYWMQGISVALFGVDEFAFRLPSILAATVWLLVLFRFVAERSSDARAPWIAAAGLSLSVMPSIIGHAATADALLNLWIAAAGLELWRHLESGQRAPLLRAALWAGLGVLTKGPIAVAVPALASLVYLLWQREPLRWLRLALHWRAWLIALAVVLPWGITCWIADDGDFIKHFLFDHNLQRYNTTLQGHGGKPWYYLIALPLIVLPFTALLPGALRQGWSGDALDRYCLSWLGVVIVAFSFSSTQLPHYALYGVTPLLVLMARRADRLPPRGLLLAPGIALLALFAALPLWLPVVAAQNDRPWESGVLSGMVAALDRQYVTITCLCLAGALLAFLRMDRFGALIATGVAVQLALWTAVAPTLAAGQQQPTLNAARYAREHGADVVAFNTHLPSFSVYRGAPTPRGLPEPGQWVFVRMDKLKALHRQLGADTLRPEFQQGGVALLSYYPPASPPTTAP